MNGVCQEESNATLYGLMKELFIIVIKTEMTKVRVTGL